MTERERFEACPFCGKLVAVLVSTYDEESGSDPYQEHTECFEVVCDASQPGGPGGCGASGGGSLTKDEAIAKWQARAAVSEWRTIESAPKNGEAFIGLNARDGLNEQRVVFFDDKSSWTNHIWTMVDSDATFHKDFFTHWKPLDEPPTTSLEKMEGE